MKEIELEQWEPLPGDPRQTQYAGQRTAQEVFEELKHRLEGMGYLPDEYFLMDREWENGREIPKDADIFCTTDYGGNEGVYLDVYLKWYEDSRPVTKSFITGKTLGETGADLDRMFLISSAITKAFHGDGETYARHLRQGERAEPEGMIVHLNPTEQRTIIEALVEQQERQEQAMSQTEQLLRRMTGSITTYLPPALVAAMRGTVQDSENRIARLLFKLAVEVNMMMNVLAAGMEISDEDLKTLRARSVREVKQTNGRISFKDAIDYQRGVE